MFISIIAMLNIMLFKKKMVQPLLEKVKLVCITNK